MYKQYYDEYNIMITMSKIVKVKSFGSRYKWFNLDLRRIVLIFYDFRIKLLLNICISIVWVYREIMDKITRNY